MEQKTGDIDWVEAALAALHRMTGIHARVRVGRARRGGDPASPVAAISLRRGTISHRLAAECRRTARTGADLSVVRAQLGSRDPGLLITTYLTPSLALQCREMGLQFIDTAGNAYLDVAGMFVFVCGQTPPDSLVRPPVRTTGNPSSQRMVFALLCKPALLQATYREIARVSGIALGSVGAVFNGLASRGWLLETHAEERRRLTAPERLLDEWVANFPTILRPRLQPRRYAASAPDWWQALTPADLAALDGYWGGEVAAWWWQDHARPARPATQMSSQPSQMLLQPSQPPSQPSQTPSQPSQTPSHTLYVVPSRMAQTIQVLTQRHRLKPNANGPIEILESFWDASIDDPARPGLVPPVLIYADLMATLQTSSLETAAELRRGALKDGLDQF